MGPDKGLGLDERRGFGNSHARGFLLDDRITAPFLSDPIGRGRSGMAVESGIARGQLVITSFSQTGAVDYRREVRAWLTTSLPEGWIESRDAMTEDQQVNIRREWDRTLFEAGYAGLSWPLKYGGRAAGVVAEAIFYDELARAGAPDGLSRLGRTVAGPLIMAAGSEHQKRTYLPQILDGTDIWCLCLSEPDAGSDLANVSTTATLEGDRYYVTGTKIWTSYAQHARRSLLLARTGANDAPRRNLTMFLMPMEQPGISVSPIRTISGDHHFNEVSFDAAVVSESDRLGTQNDGWRVFLSSLQYERGPAVTMSFYIEMCREKEVFINCCAARIGESALRRAAELETKIEIVRWHLMRVVEIEAAQRQSISARLVSKLFWTELWQEVTTFGMKLGCQTHREFWLYHYLQSRSSTIAGGTSEIQRNAIYRSMMPST